VIGKHPMPLMTTTWPGVNMPCLPSFSELLILASVLVVHGCSSNSPANETEMTRRPIDDAGSQTEAGASKLSVGAFLVELVPATATARAYTSVAGKVSDGPSPATLAWDVVEESGGCQLRKPRVPFCSPACGSGKLCLEDNVCGGYPTAQNIGPAKLSGLGTGDITMDPIANTYALPADVLLPFPPAAEGSSVVLGITQGAFGAFTLQSKMVAPLVSNGAVTLTSGQPVNLTWAAPGQPALARVEIKVDISHHGGIKGTIECDTADSGSLEISANLVSKLIDLGVAGFPTVTLTRVVTGAAVIAPGIVTLRVLSAVTREVVVTGVQSCDKDHPCPTGQSCQPNLTCAP